ncbi:MAG: NAD(P)H-hydrate epimerase [Phycisphaerales bacterium]|nr:MAG: NAD(P)H-hydrate epimerase [Phycisphaerales bacterium]
MDPRDRAARGSVRARSRAGIVRADDPPADLFLLTRAQARAIDERAVSEFGMPTIVLMENASRHVADVVLEMVEQVAEPRVVVVCGTGNNGGDGFAAARHLSNAGATVVCVLVGKVTRVVGDARTNLAIARAMGIEILEGSGDVVARACAGHRPHVVVDAIFGTGLDREVVGEAAAAIAAINAWKRGVGERGFVVAVDVPSGMDADTGRELGECIVADVTVTFAGLKAGFVSLEAQRCVGEVVVADIGVPAGLVAALGTRVETRGVIEDVESDENETRALRRRGEMGHDEDGRGA